MECCPVKEDLNKEVGREIYKSFIKFIRVFNLIRTHSPFSILLLCSCASGSQLFTLHFKRVHLFNKESIVEEDSDC